MIMGGRVNHKLNPLWLQSRSKVEVEGQDPIFLKLRRVDEIITVVTVWGSSQEHPSIHQHQPNIKKSGVAPSRL